MRSESVFRRNRATVALCLMLLLFEGMVARATAHAIAAEATSTEAIEAFTGTALSVRIDNTVTQQSVVHRELRLSNGTAMALQGSVAEQLPNGAVVRVTGHRRGSGLQALSSEVLSTPPASASVDLDGTLTIAHADDFAGGSSHFDYDVHDDAGGVTPLNVATLPSQVHGGSRVHVTGKRSTDGLSVDPDAITVEAEPASGLVAKSGTTNSVLVIMANFNNTPAPAFTQSQAQQVMTTNSNSVANFYSEVSYGGQLLNVTVTSTWVTMNLAASCNYPGIASAANTAAAALSPVYTASNYNFVVYLFPWQQSCGWSGLAYVGFPHQAFINGTGAFSTQVVGHEMGHNFGLFHAGSLNCGSATIGGTCTVAEYGDPWDTMGNQRAMHFNAMQKLGLGWIGSTTVKTHSSGSANYTISPLENGGAATYAVKIPTSNSSRTYWLEFRQPIGFDAVLSAYPNNGVQVRVSDPFEWASGADDTEILDMTPATSGNFTDSALVVGQSFLDSTYGVNIIVTAATASSVTVNVTKGGASPSTTTLSSSANPSAAGASVTFIATVTGSSPTGTVSFKDGANSIGGCAAVSLSGSGNSRTAQCATSALAAGTHSVTASYSGDANNAASSSSALSQTVNAAGSTTSIATSLTPSNFGTSVTFTATVSGSAPTGSVNFRDASTSISGCAAATLTGSGNIRTASCATSALTVGNHSITAAYGGDASNGASTSSAITQTVNKAPTTTALTSSVNPSVFGASVTFTATVTGSNPTGTVNFKDASTSLSGCSAVAVSGSGNSRIAKCTTSALTAGTHSIVASYGGDGSNAASSSVALSQVVNSSGSSTSVATSLTPATVGTSVTFTATVTGSSPTGTVNFKDGSSSIGGCSAISMSGSGNVRTANCVTAALAVGTHSITAAYSGDASNGGSTSSAISQTINKAATTTTVVSSANPSSLGDSVIFTASVTGHNPTGSVNFTDGGITLSGCGAVALSGSGGTRTAQCTAGGLTAGTHSIVASYGGDGGNLSSSSGTLSQSVQASAPPTSPSLLNPGFESPALSNGGYQYNATAADIAWTFSGNSGIERNGSAWSAAPAPEGVQAAFIQSTGSIGQALSFGPGTYTLSFMAARRGCCVSPYVQPIKVTVDGTQIGALISPPSTNWSPFSIVFSVATSGAHTIAFSGTDTSDKTTFLDAVTLTSGSVAPTSVTLASSLNPSKLKASVTFTATVTGSSPSGQVAFTANGSTIAGCATVALVGSGNSRTAACTTTFTGKGAYSIVATYGGDANNSKATSPVLAQSVRRR